MSRVIVVDWSLFLYMSYHASKKAPMPATYIMMTMILGDLKKIGANKEDTIIIAGDGRNNWRKTFIKQVKADRTPLDSSVYAEFDKLLEQVKQGTDFHIIRLDRIEADDIASVTAKYFSDKEVILLSSDSDWEMMWYYPNVKIFSPHSKSKRYKIKPPRFDIKREIAKRVMREGHNNLGVPETAEDYKVKKKCTDLINLPEWVENKIVKELENINYNKKYDVTNLPFKTVRQRFHTLYIDKSKVVTYESCIKRKERKKKKRKKKSKKKKQLKKEKKCQTKKK